MSGDSWALFVVLGLGVADPVKLGRGGQHGPAKPDGEALHVVRYDLDVDGVRLLRNVETRKPSHVRLHAPIHTLLDVALQPAVKVFEHGGPAREHDVFVEAAAHINGTVRDCLIHALERQGSDRPGKEATEGAR